MNVADSARQYSAIRAGVDRDLTFQAASPKPILATVDPLLARPIQLNHQESQDLVTFVRDALLDRRAKAENLCSIIPGSVPSGLPLLHFENCPDR